MEKSLSCEPNRFSAIQEIPHIFETQWFITVFTTARHLSQFRARSILSTPLYPTSWRSILILSYQLRLVFPSGLFPPGFSHQNPVCTSPVRHTCYTPRPSFSSFDHWNTTWWGVLNFLFMYFFQLPCYLVPLRPKYSPQHPILQHPQPTFLPQCQISKHSSLLAWIRL